MALKPYFPGISTPCSLAWDHSTCRHVGQSVPQISHDGCRQRHCDGSDASVVTTTRFVHLNSYFLDDILRNRLSTDDKHVRRIAKRIAVLVQSSSSQDRYAQYNGRILTVQ